MKRVQLFSLMLLGAVFTGCVAPTGDGEAGDEAAEAEDVGTAAEAILDANDGERMGGNGGAYYEMRCPSGFVAIGTIQSSTLSVVRQLALVCGRRSLVNAGVVVGEGDQHIIWSSWRTPTIPGYTAPIPAGSASRAVFEAGIDFEFPFFDDLHFGFAPQGSIEMLCNPGYALTGITGRAGALVDRISSIRCEWQRTTPQSNPIRTHAVNVGGWGGIVAGSSCHRWDADRDVIVDEVANGLYFRSGDVLDSVGLICAP